MIEFIRIFILNLLVKLTALLLGLFSIILIIENGAADSLENFEQYQYLLIVCSLIVLVEHTIYFMRYRKYIILPYSLSLYNRANNEQKHSKIYLDKFIKFDKKTQTIYFKNRLAIDKEAYIKNKAKIIHLLGFEDDKRLEIEIRAHDDKEVLIKIFRLPKLFNWHVHLLRDKHIYLGESKDGSYFVHMKDLTSKIICGESGSGKSNFLNLYIFSLLHNSQYLDKLYFVDLKGVELSRYKLKNCEFVDSLEETAKLVSDLKQTMLSRYHEMKEQGDLTYRGKFKICLIDEVATIETSMNKVLKQQITNDLIEIAQKGRAARVIIIIASQKIDSTNLNGNILTNLQASSTFRSSSQFNINNTVGLQEEVEEITRTRVQDFNKGRFIYCDGLDKSKKVLLQAPFLSQKVQADMIRYFRQWINI